MKIKSMVAFAVSILLAVSLAGCSASSQESSDFTPAPDPVATEETAQGNQASPPDVSYDLPSEWTSTQRKMFDAYVLFYPQTKLMDLKGKRALMENASLICQAYDEGYARREILAAITGGSISSQMSDDWMTLSVTYFCPEHFDQQRAN